MNGHLTLHTIAKIGYYSSRRKHVWMDLVSWNLKLHDKTTAGKKKSKWQTNTMHVEFSIKGLPPTFLSRTTWSNDMRWYFLSGYIDYSVHLVHSSSRFSYKTPRFISRYKEKLRLQLPYLPFTPGAFELPHWPAGEITACVQACSLFRIEKTKSSFSFTSQDTWWDSLK